MDTNPAADTTIELKEPYPLLKINGWLLLLMIVLAYQLLQLLFSSYIFNEEFYLRSFADRLSTESIQAMIGLESKYRWLGYLLTIVILVLKVSYAYVCVAIGAVLAQLEIDFKTLFKTMLLAEVVFILAELFYMANLFLHLDSLSFDTVMNYYPLTVLSYVGAGNVVEWLQYPLLRLNIFELLYMGMIAWLVSLQWKENFLESLALVVPSYGTGLILWISFVTFLTLQIS